MSISEELVHIFNEGVNHYELKAQADSGIWEYVRSGTFAELSDLETDQSYLISSVDITEFWDRVYEIRHRV